MNIVFFDSGIGGLTVLREASRTLPNESYVYYADTRHVPYGTHTKEEVFGFVASCIDEILAEHPVKAIVIACNTATSVAIEPLRARYPFPIIGMEPAVKPALQAVRESRRKVLVTATPLTLKEEKFRRLVGSLEAPEHIDSLALPGLVRLAEDGRFDGPEAIAYLQEQFVRYDWRSYGAIVLGCTHFVFFRDTIRRLLPDHVAIMDGNTGTVRQMMRVLGLSDDQSSAAGTSAEKTGRELPNIRYMSSIKTEEERARLEAVYLRLP